MRHSQTPLLQYFKAGMRDCGPVKLQPVAEKSPGERRVGMKPVRRRQITELATSKRWICLPEPLGPAEVWQPRIYSHPSTSGNQQSISSFNRPCSSVVSIIQRGHTATAFLIYIRFSDNHTTIMVRDSILDNFATLRGRQRPTGTICFSESLKSRRLCSLTRFSLTCFHRCTCFKKALSRTHSHEAR